MKLVEIFTDGACRGNPGPGGWGALMRYQNKEKEIWGGQLETTNNQMELKAAIEALKLLKEPCEIVLTTDSQYVRKGITEWLANWKQKAWKNSQRKLVKNKELWQELDALAEPHQIHWHWVKGHSGHPENERADALANKGIEDLFSF